jgi:hypothetical protein
VIEIFLCGKHDLYWRQLPWSTANEDLVELFETTGQVELAEILFDGTRSKGCGVVQFAQVPEAETAIGESYRFDLPDHALTHLRQPNSSSICTVGALSTCASTTGGILLHRLQPRAVK